MVYASELARVNLVWTPNETPWPGEGAVCGFWLRHNHSTGVTFEWDHELQYLADKVVEKLGDHWSALAGFSGSGYQIAEVRAAQIGTDGRETNAKTSAVEAGTLAGSGSNILPPEVAMCVSLYAFAPGTFTTHPGRKRSRLYWPYINSAFASGQGKVQSVDSAVTAMFNFFNDINGMHADSGGGPGSFDYWQLVAASAIGAEVNEIRYIAIDDHFDSQRRRQHQSPAVRTVSDELTISSL